LAEFITSLIPGTSANNSVKIVVSFLIYVAVLALIAFARPIALAIPAVRNRIEPRDRFAGQYVQIIENEESRRYSLIDVSFVPKLGSYELRGFQYEPNGLRAIDFTSQNVAFRFGPITYMEFVWQAETISDKERFEGYTMMRYDDVSNADVLEGRGFFITFHHEPKRFNMRFIKISDVTLDKLNSASAADEKLEKSTGAAERARFVKQLHRILEAHPELHPMEETSKPIL